VAHGHQPSASEAEPTSGKSKVLEDNLATARGKSAIVFKL